MRLEDLKTEEEELLRLWCIVIICLAVVVLIVVILIAPARAEITDASYYTVASCLREGTSGITSSGERLKDDGFTAASWDYPFGTFVRVRYLDRCVVVRINDRGPSKRLYRSGRRLDLSRAAFLQLAPLSKGVIRVDIERIP